MRYTSLILVLLVAGSLAAAWTWRVEAVRHQRQTIRFAYQGTTDDARHLSALQFKTIVESVAGGVLRVELYPGGQLGGDRDAIEGVSLGTIEMTAAGAGIFANFEPRMGVTALPFLFDNFEEAWAFCDSEPYQEVLQYLLRSGIRVLGQWDNGFRCVTNSLRPIQTPEDLRGMKIRTPENPIILSTMQTLGADPSPLPWTELYMALQQGAYDGQENPVPIIHANKLYEIQKYLSITNHIYEPMPVVVSEFWWNGLDDGQRAVIQCAVLTSQEFNRALIKQMSQEQISELQAFGMEVNYPDLNAFKAATMKVRDQFRDIIGADLIKTAYEFKN